jgi:hypothetical protein
MVTPPPIENRKLIITKEEIRVADSNMKDNRAPGPGVLPAELLNYGPEGVLEVLTNLFNKCLEKGKMPAEWKMGYLVSTFKKGNRKDPRNYRGITVGSSIGRVYSIHSSRKNVFI